ncbi:PREDICTED: cysteine-rich repeat secretory protein 38-like [Ipomoea nil]|uniref:cysteine-rich repeat secretory protein 38-like n=1 Tax=Ipomoea nil TaxID=35883 RepID=UPI000901BC2C|nr:PREDICTED: cysteine-rich repeat secretory protein 38-like [Ipomoea nil]
MAYSKPFSLLPLLSIAFILALHTPMAAAQLRHFCANFATSPPDSLYRQNLNTLLGNLSSNTPRNGYSSGTAGKCTDKVYGLALCRGDVSTTDCKSCVADATTKIRELCPKNNGAIIWYDNCLLKYSEDDFFGEIDDVNKFYMANGVEAKDPKLFMQKTKELLTRLAAKAALLKSSYAAGEEDIGASVTLYGLTQCTRDLSGEDCKKCLDDAIAELPQCCGTAKVGGRVIQGSCNFRYETFPFYNGV